MSVIETAKAWIASDPDPDTRAELESLIESDSVEQLEARFSETLRFGTAGLRGLIGAGPGRMNRVTVSRATAGLCEWLLENVPEATSRGICVGRDARPKSDRFERDVIEVATGAGFRVFAFSEVVPTPVLAFAALRLGTAGAVMITASHNPPGYNGYKVYWENGAQIIPPNDAGIADAIEAAPTAAEIPRLSLDAARDAGLLKRVDSVRDEYVSAIAGELGDRPARSLLRIAYTALHGVAQDTFLAAMRRAGFTDLQSVSSQAAPDGTFPTVTFPNPEEPGAMDEVLSLAQKIEADLAIAHDPDGDRVAVAARGDDGFRVLSGNDIGILLADDLLRQSAADRPLVLSTVVSSPLLGPVARRHGARWERTLTGHKWIQNRALELETEGFEYVFGYEEALGYATSALVRDKDGISAALRLADLATRCRARGQTLLDARDALFREHGYVADRQVSVRFEGATALADMEARVDAVRESPPHEIAGAAVLRVLDLERQVERTPDGERPFDELPESNVLILELEGGHRVMIRPSGTEPKLKYYLYAVAEADVATDLAQVEAEAGARIDAMLDDLTRASDC